VTGGGYVEPPPPRRSADVVWYNSGDDQSSTSSSRDATSSPDDLRLHRSSPLTALNSIYVIDEQQQQQRQGQRQSVASSDDGGGGGVVNCGFVGDAVLTDSWRRVSWRARLRAGIARSSDADPARSSVASTPPPAGGGGGGGATRRPSYLSDVIDSVTFFSQAAASTLPATAQHRERRELPLSDVPAAATSVARCRSDGGEWTLRRDRHPCDPRDPCDPCDSRDPCYQYRTSSLQASGGQRRAQKQTYYTYVRPSII